MRVSKQQAMANRERMLTEAAKMFRERGFAAAGVDALADAAGFTHGSLYSQFGSKDRLAAEALAFALLGSAEKLDACQDLDAYVSEYLSPVHRARRADGCALAALVSEMPRQSAETRAAFTAGVQAMVQRLAALIPDHSDDQTTALAAAATMVGALVLARGVADSDLSDRFLAAGKAKLARPAKRRRNSAT